MSIAALGIEVVFILSAYITLLDDANDLDSPLMDLRLIAASMLAGFRLSDPRIYVAWRENAICSPVAGLEEDNSTNRYTSIHYLQHCSSR